MAITYIISPCPKGFGIYVRALSGDELRALLYKLPEITTDSRGNMSLFDKPLKGAVACQSDRLMRKKSLPQANKALKKLKALTPDEQIAVCAKRFIKPIEKEFKLLKLQYNRFSWKHGDKWISPFTTQNKEQAEKLAIAYASSGTPAKLTPTVGKNRKLTHKDYDKALAMGEVKATYPKGLKGMCKPLKDQGPEMLNRISQRRKRTTRNEFFQKYR